MMKYKLHSNKKIFFLLVLFVGLAVWTGITGYKHFNTHIEESSHYIIVSVDASKNLTYEQASEVDGSYSVKYIIFQKGSLYFHTMYPGWSLFKEVNVTNRNNYPVVMSYKTSGNVSEFVVVEVPKTLLAPKESVSIDVGVIVPQSGAVSGNYKGNLTIRLTPKR